MWSSSAWWLLIPPLCCFVRVYFCAHWLGDTLAGVVVGVSVVKILAALSGGLDRIGFFHPLLLSSIVAAVAIAVLMRGKKRRKA